MRRDVYEDVYEDACGGMYDRFVRQFGREPDAGELRSMMHEAAGYAEEEAARAAAEEAARAAAEDELDDADYYGEEG